MSFSGRRLTPQEVKARAINFGVRLVSDVSSYENNETVLMWRCAAHRSHVFDASLGHLVRGCPMCRKDSRDAERRYAEFDAIAAIVGTRGDILLSGPKNYANQRSLIRYACSKCGEEASQRAVKVKIGQGHSCAQMTAAHMERRRDAHAAVRRELEAGGIVLLTPVEEYGGLRSVVKFRLASSPSKGGVLEATVLRLKRMVQR